MTKFTPTTKKGVSPVLPLAGVICVALGIWIFVVSLKRTEDIWILLITAPFSIFLIWLSKCFLAAFLNAHFSTTEVEFTEEDLAVRNTPFGRSFTIPISDIRDIIITDILSPKVAMELLLTTKDLKAIQILACRKSNDEMRFIAERIRK